MVDLSQLNGGSYQVMIGFYDAISNQRLVLVAPNLTVLDDQRLMLGLIEVK